MNKKLICLLAFVFSLCLGFTACSDDDDDPVNPVELKLDKATVSVEAGKTVEVKVTQGNGTYVATPATPATATAEVKNDVITITGVAAGETDVVVKDKNNKSATVKVTVTAAPVTDYAEEIAGTYKGAFSIELVGQGDPQVLENEEVKVVRTAENKIELLLEDFSFGNIPVGDIKVSDITLTEENGTVKLADKTIEEAELNEGAMTATIALVSSTVKDGKLVLTINVKDVTQGETSLPLVVNVSFDGTIVTSEE